MKIYFVSVLAGVVAVFAAIMLFAFLTFAGFTAFVSFFAILAFSAGCLVCGNCAGRMRKRRGIFIGAKAAVVFTAVVSAAALCFGTFTGAEILGRIVIAAVCGGIGGIIAVNNL